MKISYRDVIRTPSNLLGLARNSTLLNRLSSAGLIASWSWGYYQGWTGAETQHQLDGSLVLGGYDEAKTTGKNTTLSFSDSENCVSGLLVTVRDIKMNLQNGTDLSIFGSSAGSAMSACLNPTYPLMSLPVDIWNSFVQFSEVDVLYRSWGINSWAMLISGNGSFVFFYQCMMQCLMNIRYAGDLTVTLSSGLEIRIPNHQLVLPDYHISPQGEFIINGSDRVVRINSLQDINRNDMPIFGQLFLVRPIFWLIKT